MVFAIPVLILSRRLSWAKPPLEVIYFWKLSGREMSSSSPLLAAGFSPSLCLFVPVTDFIFKTLFLKKKKVFIFDLGLQLLHGLFSGCGEWGFLSFLGSSL